jgi:predicted alpha/beta hydrolase family esterase
MSKRKIYLIHGYTAYSTANWFPAFRQAFENTDTEVIVFDMPNSQYPKYEEWLQHLEKEIVSYSESDIFIGHSLGCVTLLNYLNRNRTGKVKAYYLISGFVEETPLPELTEFVIPKLDYDYLKELTDTRVAISAKDDDIVPYDYSVRMAEKLNITPDILPEGKHFIDRDGFVEFEYLVERVKEI